MPRPYRARNKRIIHRASNGRFRNSTFEDIGIPNSEVQDGYAICGKCGHGSDENKRWYPLLKTGYCPECNSQEKAVIEVHPFDKIPKNVKERVNNMGHDELTKAIDLTTKHLSYSFVHPEILSQLQVMGICLNYNSQMEILLDYMKEKASDDNE
jgi:hypothetical protein